MESERPLGIFDSGIGGLTVFREIRKRLPRESLVYLGDTARVPYGAKSEKTVQRYARECAAFLRTKKVKMVVVACNTASAFALEALQGDEEAPVVGVVVPGAKGAVRRTRSRKIGVIGTEGTIRSGAYERAIKKFEPAAEVTSVACPLFVPLVEEGWLEDPATRLIAERYLSALRAKRIDTLILGCTHYPLLKPVLHQVMGETVLIDSAEETAREVEKILGEKKLAALGGSPPSEEFFVTDSTARFRRVGEIFMGGALSNVTQVEI